MNFKKIVVVSVVASTVVCWGITVVDRKRLSKLLKKAGYVLGYSLDSVEEVVERRMMATPLQDTLSWVEP